MFVVLSNSPSDAWREYGRDYHATDQNSGTFSMCNNNNVRYIYCGSHLQC